jgi:hypothetical protein
MRTMSFEPCAASRGQLDAVAIAVGASADQDITHARLRHAADADERVDHGLPLGLHLRPVGYVLPLAAPAFSEIRAGRLAPFSGGFDDLDYPGTKERAAVLGDLGDDRVTRASRGHEHCAPIVGARDSVAAVGERVDRQCDAIHGSSEAAEHPQPLMGR